MKIKIVHKKQFKRDAVAILFVAVFFFINILIFKSWFCPFYDGIGVPDPGDGFTSAVRALMRMDFTIAFKHHPMIYPVLMFIPYYAYERYFREKPTKYFRYIIGVLIAMFLIVYVIRLLFTSTYFYELGMNYDSVLFKMLR